MFVHRSMDVMVYTGSFVLMDVMVVVHRINRKKKKKKKILIFQRNKLTSKKIKTFVGGGGGGREGGTTIYKGIKQSNKHILKRILRIHKHNFRGGQSINIYARY